MLERTLDLQKFEGGAGAGTGAAGTGGAEGTGTSAESTEANGGELFEEVTPEAEGTAANKPQMNDKEKRSADFESLIKGEYKDEYTARTQQMIDARFKQAKIAEEQLASITPVIDMIAEKYGVGADDIEKLVSTIEDDDSFFEEQATEMGLTVEQLKSMRRLERENEQLKEAREAMEQRKHADEVYSEWLEQSEQLQQIYPSFNLQAEASEPETGDRFVALLRSGIDVKTAYEVIHKDDIIGGAMQHTAQVVQQKTINDIRSRGLRPDEHGTGNRTATAIVKKSIANTTKAEREEIARRVQRGERIEL